MISTLPIRSETKMLAARGRLLPITAARITGARRTSVLPLFFFVILLLLSASVTGKGKG